MNYSKSPSSHIKGSPYGKQLNEGPIHDFATVVEKTIPEDWQKRTQALVSLVATIPSGEEYISVEAWYNTPPILRHLAWPLSEMLKDPRSTVVIKTCESAAELFSKCQMDARYLLKDIMPTVLALHAQTVHVIRAAVQDMVVDSMAVTPCKMVMPIWLDRLKTDKSRTVREACALYLGVALNEWTEPGYLSIQIWEQVGTALTKALRDPAPTVRQNAKRGLETVNRMQPDVFDALLDSSDLVRDVRVRKTLARIQAGESVADDVSVTSYGSRGGGGSGSSVASSRRLGMRIGSGGSVAGSRSGTPRGSQSTTRKSGSEVARPGSAPIPTTIGVATKSSAPTKKGGGLGPPVRVPGPFQAAVDSPPKIERLEEPKADLSTPSGEVPAVNGELSTPKVVDVPVEIPDVQPSNTSFDTAETNESDLPVIANVDVLREYAKIQQGSSRRSSVLQERFARSATQSSEALGSTMNLDDILDESDGKDNADGEINGEASKNGVGQDTEATTSDAPPIVSASTPPEHVRVAQALLEAHKKHVDLIMETLKVEMDAMKEFEMVMLQEDSSRPTEDEVLEYFESVGLCVDQRAKAGSIFSKKMMKISNGAV